MKKIGILVLLLSIFLITGCVDKNSDAYKFKKEYESINNKDNGHGNKHRSLSIPDDNPFVYATCKDIVEKINNKETFVVYFGFKECPWCRSVLPELINVAKDKEIETIYYVDVKDVRDVKEYVDGEIKTTKMGDKYYIELISILDKVLDEYTLSTDEGEISTGEKRIYAPNIIAIGEGVPIQMETGISDELKDPYSKLTKKIKKYAYNKFKCVLECIEEESTVCVKDKC